MSLPFITYLLLSNSVAIERVKRFLWEEPGHKPTGSSHDGLLSFAWAS
jgi:hypothetical protein